MVLILLCSLLIFVSIWVESFGAYFRVIGTLFGKPSLGYSTHVRVATLSRFFILFSAPMLGHLVDSGSSLIHFIYIAFVVFSLYFIFSITTILFVKQNFLISFFKFINWKFIKDIKYPCDSNSISFSMKFNKLTIYSVLSFSFTSVGLISVNGIASYFPEFRAMAVQTSAIITMIGTIIHVLYIDPILSNSSDSSLQDVSSVVNSFLSGRVIVSLLYSLLFLILIIYNNIFIYNI